MLHLDAQRIDAQRIGATHGLDLAAAFDTHGATVRQCVENLYGSRHEEGCWTKWLNLPYDEALVDEINAYAQSVRSQFDDCVILGIGGSSLGGLALLKALLPSQWNAYRDPAKRQGLPRYHFVDNVDADVIQSLLEDLDLSRTLVIVISKSGTTAESMAAFLLFKARLDAVVGAENAKRHLVAVTDRRSGVLRPLADSEGYQTFEVPDDVGGRFSVFSAVGLLPAALCGVDIAALLRGAREVDTLLKNPDVRQNPAAQNALIHWLYYQQGKRLSVMMPYSASLSFVADWYVQLYAESLGKRFDRQGNEVHIGPTPVKSVGVTDQHSQLQLYMEGPHDKVITFIAVESPGRPLPIPDVFPQLRDKLGYVAGKSFEALMKAEFEGTRTSLTNQQRPSVTLTLPVIDAYHLGQLLFFFEVQVALMGGLFGIDPFDQPGVEDSKKIAKALMGEPGLEHLADSVREQSRCGGSAPMAIGA
ncbi:MAG: glucose-6-phosphate isomerase [Vampirovibrionales bacterium]|nr:glucose-6-phosphate isomerase [Vampirovibrionales bacterium]